VAQRVQSHPTASVLGHASASARNSKSNWYINKGLDTVKCLSERDDLSTYEGYKDPLAHIVIGRNRKKFSSFFKKNA